jgi:RHS repeat-associated protein
MPSHLFLNFPKTCRDGPAQESIDRNKGTGYAIPNFAYDFLPIDMINCSSCSSVPRPFFIGDSPGKERDAETGLDYFGARYFSAAQGRFASPDPLLNSGRPWEPQSWNRYAYVLNNPLRFTDPIGLWEWDASLGGSYSDIQLKEHYKKKEAKQILSLRKDIRNSISKLDKSKDPVLQAAGAAYGTEGVANGISIAMGPVTKGAAAQFEFSGFDGDHAKGTVRVPEGMGENSLFTNLAHEGTHASNAQAAAFTSMYSEGGVLTFTRYATEMNGYLATSAAAHSLGINASVSVGVMKFVLWNSAWTKVDLRTQPQQNIDKLLHASPLYNNPKGTPPRKLDDVLYGSK